MCGICGFVGAPREAALESMLGALVHRGPDSAGIWRDGEAALGVRRLSIVDLETGGQPVHAQNTTAVFNGEIYNHRELRRELEASGRRFRSDHGDAEIIPHLYERDGDEFLHRLNGMFAIALWDADRRRLFLARDRLGIKPLYYAWTGKDLVFGSEIKALLRHPAIGRSPDLTALHHYFTFKNIPAPFTAFASIRQLRPGETAILEGGRLSVRPWWSPRCGAGAGAPSEAEATMQVRSLLRDSVRMQMKADVPVGAYLSGGVDSSSIVALMRDLEPDADIDTFTLTYDDASAGKQADRDFARDVSRRCRTRHHEATFRPEDLTNNLSALVEAFDEPFSGSASTWFLTREIARHVKAALSGDGADECFGSYLPHRLAPYRLVGGDELSAGDRRRLDMLAAMRDDETSWRMAMTLATDSDKSALMGPALRDAAAAHPSAALVARELAAAQGGSALNRMLFLDQRTLLPDQVLTFVDRLSMAHSVEVRPPFLDHRLVDFVNDLPDEYKMRAGRTKHILKQAVSGLLPQNLIDRPKEGFIPPINDWLVKQLAPFAKETLSPTALACHGLLDSDAVQALLVDAELGRGRAGDKVWNLLMFQLWWDCCVKNGDWNA